MKRRDGANVGAVAYTRVSTAEQASEGLSLDAQEERVRAYCQAQGLELGAVLREEAVSGAVPLAERPQGAILEAMLADGARHVVALKLDRLFRDAADALTVTRAWDSSGVAVHLVDMGGSALNTTSAMGRVFLTMTAAFAELERNLISERTSLALGHKMRRGEHVGRVPRGARMEGKRLVADDEALSLYRRARDLRRGGKTFEEVCESLEAEGFVPTRGRRFWPSSVHALVRNETLARLDAGVAS